MGKLPCLWSVVTQDGAVWSSVRSPSIANIVQIMNTRKVSFKGFKAVLFLKLGSPRGWEAPGTLM